MGRGGLPFHFTGVHYFWSISLLTQLIGAIALSSVRRPDVGDDHGVFHHERTQVVSISANARNQGARSRRPASRIGGRSEPGGDGDRRHASP